MLDFIFIGGGIACLYAAYELLKVNPNLRFVILEKDDCVGGRIGTKKFHNVDINIGAGVGRFEKDILLKKLLSDLEIPFECFVNKIAYSEPGLDVGATLQLLQNYRFTKHPTFSLFGKCILGNEMFKELSQRLGFTDYCKADAKDTIENYGLEDNYGNPKSFKVDWNRLLIRLTEEIGQKNIKCRCNVTNVRGKTVTFSYQNSPYKVCAKKIVIGTTINCLKRLLKGEIYNHIKSQHFLRVYAVVENLSLKNYVIVNSPLQKVAHIGKDVFMISYSDNAKSDELMKHINDIHYFEKLLQKSLYLITRPVILDMVYWFWEEGTHFFPPLPSNFTDRNEFIKKAQRPRKNVWVIGEAVSIHQGWTEGALESFVRVFKSLKK